MATAAPLNRVAVLSYSSTIATRGHIEGGMLNYRNPFNPVREGLVFEPIVL
jgi:hypothetical protein